MPFITFKNEQNNYRKMFYFCFFRSFFTYFSIQTLYFLLTGGAKIFLAPERRVP